VSPTGEYPLEVKRTVEPYLNISSGIQSS